MDKIILSKENVDDLLAWRDKNIELIYTLPCPIKCIAMEFPFVKIRAVVDRDDREITFRLSHGGKPIGNKVLTVGAMGLLHQKRSTLKDMPEEGFQAVVTSYCSLMALMVYGADSGSPVIPTEKQDKITYTAALYRERKRTGKKPSKPGVTYILRTGKHGLSVGAHGHHASPQGVFGVRGHYRHYKNGHVVWISEYTKGRGKKKDKTYKLGGLS